MGERDGQPSGLSGEGRPRGWPFLYSAFLAPLPFLYIVRLTLLSALHGLCRAYARSPYGPDSIRPQAAFADSQTVNVDKRPKTQYEDRIFLRRTQMERQRSPSYPALSLDEAIDSIAKLHKAVRTNVVPRETAAKDMGYSGLTGRSLTVLAALAQYGLVEKAGKGDIKVTRRAVEILHPVEPGHRVEAIKEAANAPTLFRDIRERFPDGIPSANALRSYLIQRDFQDAAIGSAISAFLETNAFVEKEAESERSSEAQPSDDEVPQPPKVPVETPQFASPGPSAGLADAALNKINMNIQGEQVMISGLLDLKGLALLEQRIKALKLLLTPIYEPNDTDADNPSDDFPQ